MTAPYRIILVGPGAIGQATLRELIRLPEFELVGVLGFSQRKNGLDVGELLNQQPTGIQVTLDQQSIVDLEADCVIWCGYFPMPHLVEPMDELIVQLLVSGKNVVTPVRYHYPHLHGDAQVKRLEDACRQGNSSLHGTGENPGFWFERLALTLTGLCTQVDSIQLDEYCDIAATTGSQKMWNAAGFGLPVEQAAQLIPFRETWQNYMFVETLNLASVSLYGKALDKFEMETEYHLTEAGFKLSKTQGNKFDMTFPAGTVAAQTHHFHGYLDGVPKLKVSVNWFFTPEQSPYGEKKDSTWDIEIEGRPTSIRCTTAVQASFKENLDFYPGDDTSPTYYATAATLIQAVPVVCAQDPGIVYPSIFASCAPDLRQLATRTSVVG